MRQFVPMTDELLYRSGGPPGRLVPYRTGVDCWHALGEDGIYRFGEDAIDEFIARTPRQAIEAANDAAAIPAALAQPA